jgi:hypothetical protein
MKNKKHRKVLRLLIYHRSDSHSLETTPESTEPTSETVTTNNETATQKTEWYSFLFLCSSLLFFSLLLTHIVVKLKLNQVKMYQS